MTVADELTDNKFAARLRVDGVFDEIAYAGLRRGLADLASEWAGQDKVDKEVAGWLIFTLLVILGAKERISRNGAADLDHRLSLALGDLYEDVESCFRR